MNRRCSECGVTLSKRADALTCSGKCRTARSRRLDARVQRGACVTCLHDRSDPIHDDRATGHHAYIRMVG